MASSPSSRPGDSSGVQERSARVRRLQDALLVCPTDIVVRCELATLLEELGEPAEALSNWQAVLACDPNNLKAWEGLARCHRRIGRSAC
jgi:Flp pilus assembly protein TadD